MLKRLMILFLLNDAIESYLKQSNILTKPLDEELVANKFVFYVDKVNYSLIRNVDKPSSTFFSVNFLSESDTVSYAEAKKVYATLQMDDDQFDVRSIEIYSKKQSLAYKNPSIPGAQSQQQLNEGGKEFTDPVIDFSKMDIAYITIVYFTHVEQPEIGILKHLMFEGIRNRHRHLTYKWQKRSSRSDTVRLFLSQNTFDTFLFYNEEFKKYEDEEEEEKERLNGEILPYFGNVFFNLMYGLTPNLYEMPFLCSEHETIDRDQLYKSIIDVYHDIGFKNDSSFFILAQNSKNMAICFMDEEMVETFHANGIFRKKSESYCDMINNREVQSFSMTDDSVCRPKKLKIINVLWTSELNSYKRILVLSEKSNTGKRSLVFLLDSSNRLAIHSIEIEKSTVTEHCFEGIFKLLNSDVDEILDIKLDTRRRAIIVVTASYIQKIPIESFCLPNSPFTSCSGRLSVCNGGQRLPVHCNETESNECVEPDRTMHLEPFRSEPFLCEKNRYDWEMCLLADERMIHEDKRKNFRFCNEKSCTCLHEICVRAKCSEHVVPLKCPLPKSTLLLPDFPIDSLIEPQYIIIVSSFLTFLSITIILIVFYCCFAITQANKRQLAISQMSTVGLSKLEYRDDS